MDKDEQYRKAEYGSEAGRVGEAPGKGREKEEEGEEVSERGVGSVPGIFCFCDGQLCSLV